jgi:GNAT superfamily N-acetyltransferase
VAQQRELREVDGGLDGQVFMPHDDAKYLVVAVRGRVVACGAWQALDDGVAEIKRMYVRPAHRGAGIGRQLIVALEEEALAADRPTVRLETGTYLPSAITRRTCAGSAASSR